MKSKDPPKLKEEKLKQEKLRQEIVQEALLDNNPAHSIWKNPVVIIILSLFILILFLSTYLVFFPLSRTVEGSFHSAALEANTLDVDQLHLEFQDNTAQKIQDLYLNEQQTEFSLCLFGEKTDPNDHKESISTYSITSFMQPTQYSQTFSEVQFAPCPENTLILFHTHPYKSCLASDQDIRTLRESQQQTPGMLMLIMCESERFAVYE